MRNEGRLSGKVALVTGAGTGIGRAAALSFASAGACVALVGRTDATLRAVAEEIQAREGRAFAFVSDVSEPRQVRDLVDQVVATCGALDVAFNNAGTEGAFKPIHQMDDADFDRTVAVNLRGVWLCIKHEVSAMLRAGKGGSIVNTSSWLATGAMAGSSAYSASKGALDAMVRAIALEVGPAGIRINNVSPGIIDTPMFRRFADDEAAKPFAAFTPLQRLGQPADVGDVAVWLSTHEARFVTGQSILVDGGYAIGGMR